MCNGECQSDSECADKKGRKERKARPVETFEDAVKRLFHADDHDALANDMGYDDRHQMFYYENQQVTNEADTIARACGYENAQSITDELNRMEMEEAMRHREPLQVTDSLYNKLQNSGYNTANIKRLNSV